MTAAEHIVCWIESSQPHYRRLLKLSVPGNFVTERHRAQCAFNIAADAQHEMVRCGDAYRSEQNDAAILAAAAMLCTWKLED